MKTKQSNNSATIADAVKIASQRALQPFNLEWENDTVFKKRELNYKTKTAFQKDLDAGKISKYTTVFIKDTKEIYKNGQYYGGVSSGGSKESVIFDLSKLNSESGSIDSDVKDRLSALGMQDSESKYILFACNNNLYSGTVRFIAGTYSFYGQCNTMEIQDSKVEYLSINIDITQDLYNKSSSDFKYLKSGLGDKFLSDDGTYKEVQGGSSNTGVGKVDSNSDGTGEIFNNYDDMFANVASGSSAHAEGFFTKATGERSHAEGSASEASGLASHAEGGSTASGEYSHAGGMNTVANTYAQTTIGSFNTPEQSPSPESFNIEKGAFIIGNGQDGIPGNAFKVLFNGKTFADGEYSSTGADYAEMFEWNDGNINNEDRVGLFVSLDCDKIKIAKSTDSNIIGIISGNPSIIGDNPMRWNNKYLTDEWGRTIIEDVEVKYFEDEKYIDKNNIKSIRKVEKTRIDRIPKLNPDYNNELDYLLRTERKEWDAVGLLGKLLVRQDGTLKVGGYCKPNDNGVATNSDSGYIVMKVINEKQALVLFK